MDSAAFAVNVLVTLAVPIPVQSSAAAVRTEMHLFFLFMDNPLSQESGVYRTAGKQLFPMRHRFLVHFIITYFVQNCKNEITIQAKFVRYIRCVGVVSGRMHKLFKDAQNRGIIFVDFTT